MEVYVSYLHPDPKTGVLRYRRIFPPRLRPHIPGNLSELKVTLEARSITEPGAMDRFEAAGRRYDAMVARAEKVAAGTYDALDAPMIAYLAEKFRISELAHDNARRWDPDAKAVAALGSKVAEEVGFEFPAVSSELRWTQSIRLALEAALDATRTFRASGDLSGIVESWKDKALELANDKGLVVDPSGASFGTLCVAINDAAVSAYSDAMKRLDGELIATPQLPQAPAPSPKSPAKTFAQERSFQAIALELIDKRNAGFNEPTKERVRGALRFLEEAVGVLTPSELTAEKVTIWLDLLAERPSKLPKADFHCTLHELAKRYADKPDVPRLVPKTIEAYCLALNARWKEAQGRGAIPKSLVSPFSDRKFSRKATGPKAAKGFSEDELKAYFAMPAFKDRDRPVRGKGEAIYWIPLLMMFTGARPEEVAQLLVSDIFQHEQDGRWVIRFTDEGMHPVKGQQSLKTEGQESGRRTFPVPQPLLDLGLLEYRKHLEDAGEQALFPLLRRKGKRSGIYASFGEWMCDYVYDKGVLERGKGRQPVREFRHTWTTAARASRLPREAMEYIQGHRPPDGGSAHEGYGERDDLGNWVDELKFKVDILPIVPRWQP